MDKAGGRVTRPGSHSSRPKRAGSATLENSIADRAALVEGAGVRTGGVRACENNAESVRGRPQSRRSHRRGPRLGVIWALLAAFRRARRSRGAGRSRGKSGSRQSDKTDRACHLCHIELKMPDLSRFYTLCVSRERGRGGSFNVTEK